VLKRTPLPLGIGLGLALSAACARAPQATPFPAQVAGTAMPGPGLELCGLANAAWTDAPRLLRSARPAANAYGCLAQAGVDVIVEQLPEGESAAGARPAAESAGLEYLNLSLPDDTAPSPELLRSWLEAVDERLAAGQVVLVHDAAGRGRIGFWEAAYLMRRGVPARQAIEERYLAKVLPFDGARIGCDDGGHGQVQALAELAAHLEGAAYYPAVDEYGTAWADCPRPAYMTGWDYAQALPAP
jgi:hypothetical protein